MSETSVNESTEESTSDEEPTLPEGAKLAAVVFLMLELSVYWIFAVMIFDYCIKAVMLMHRYHSRKWLDIKISVPG